ncbi:MraY family glycosyltransferase [Spirochaetota bacterium]
MALLFAGLVACLFNIVLIPLIILTAKKMDWYDQVNERKIHKGKIPRLGGAGIFVSFVVSIIAVSVFSVSSAKDILGFWPLIIALVIVFATGLVDDFKDLKASIKFVFHMAAAIIVCAAGYRFSFVYIPWFGNLSLGGFSWLLTLVWIVGVINAMNMIDGMDGLSGGIGIISAFSMGVILLGRGMHTPALAAIVLLGALTGYLFYNFPPAKIFMGDSGSTFLGFILAILPLIGARDHGALWLWNGITVLLLPVFDVFAAMIRRSRKGVDIMSPDNWHIHHKLLRLGLGTRGILAVVYAWCMGLGAVAISSLYLPALVHWVLTIVSWSLLTVFFMVLHFMKEHHLNEKGKTEEESAFCQP